MTITGPMKIRVASGTPRSAFSTATATREPITTTAICRTTISRNGVVSSPEANRRR